MLRIQGNPDFNIMLISDPETPLHPDGDYQDTVVCVDSVDFPGLRSAVQWADTHSHQIRERGGYLVIGLSSRVAPPESRPDLIFTTSPKERNHKSWFQLIQAIGVEILREP